MQYYAIFHQRDLSGAIVEALGDRSVVRLDGRMSDASMRAVAADECKKRGYVAWHIAKGDRLLDVTPVTRVHSVEYKTDLETISARINARSE